MTRAGAAVTGAGLLWVDKPAGPTSHDVVDWVRWSLRTRQVGHCGTLDPAATGLLVVCVGAATKLASLLTGSDKEYRAVIGLGTATTTADADGEVTVQARCGPHVGTTARAEVCGMVGSLVLPPPTFSAVHVDGERAHERARRGEIVHLAERRMDVRNVADVTVGPGRTQLTGDGGLELHATFTVSKGTYIRSLAVELGRRLGVPAHLAGLRRLASGPARVEDPRTAGPLTAHALGPAPGGKGTRWRIRPAALPEGGRDELGQWLAEYRLPPWTGVPVPVVHLAQTSSDTDALITRLGHGQAASLSDPAWAGKPPAQRAIVVATRPPGREDTLILVERSEGAIRPRRVITPA